MGRNRKKQSQKPSTQRNMAIVVGIIALLVIAYVALSGGSNEKDQADTSWRSLGLTNAQTGEAFTLADFEGKTVVVKLMSPT